MSNHIKPEFHPGDMVHFAHSESDKGYLPAQVVAVHKGKVQLRIHKWLGRHWFPVDRVVLARQGEFDGLVIGKDYP